MSSQASELLSEDLLSGCSNSPDETAALRAITTDIRTRIASVGEERRLIATLVSKLGVDTSDLLDAVGEARALMRATHSTLRSYPAVALLLSRRLDQDGQVELASIVARLGGDAPQIANADGQIS